MLEKFYFESFLIAFSAFIGAIISFIFYWTIEKSGLNRPRKIVFLIILFILAIIFIIIILWIVIYFIGIN